MRLLNKALGAAQEALDVAYRAFQGVAANSGTLGTQVIFPAWRVGPVNAPTNLAVGPTQGWQFAVGNLLYSEVPLAHGVDRTKDITVGIAWAAVANELNKKVTWQIDVGFESVGHNLGNIDATYQALDTVVPDNSAGIYVHTQIVIPAADWGADPATDELHIRLSRIVNAADPVTDPGIHHQANIQRLVVG
jgi:hypothetical protein